MVEEEKESIYSFNMHVKGNNAQIITKTNSSRIRKSYMGSGVLIEPMGSTEHLNRDQGGISLVKTRA